MVFFGLWLILMAYFGPYKQYVIERDKIEIRYVDRSKVTVFVGKTGKTKKYGYDDFFNLVTDDKDSK